LKKTTQTFKNKGFRVNSDLRNNKIGYKIRVCMLQIYSYQLMAGDMEIDELTVAVCVRSGDDFAAIP